jgi:hypothetical protein
MENKRTTYGKLTSEKITEEKQYIIGLEEKLKEDPTSLTLEEIIFLKKQRGENTDKVNLIYKQGFVMVPKDDITKAILNQLPFDIRGMVDKIRENSNLNSCIHYDDKTPISNLSGLKDFLGVSKRAWDKFSLYNKNFEIVKKAKLDGRWYLYLNPLIGNSKYEIDYFKFMTFGRLLKENGYLSELDYALLCKKHDTVLF